MFKLGIDYVTSLLFRNDFNNTIVETACTYNYVAFGYLLK